MTGGKVINQKEEVNEEGCTFDFKPDLLGVFARDGERTSLASKAMSTIEIWKLSVVGEVVGSPGNEQDLPRRCCRIIGAEDRGRNPGKRQGCRSNNIRREDLKEEVLEAKLSREFLEGR